MSFIVLQFSSVAGLVIVLTIPALYERYEDYVDKYIMLEYRRLLHLYALIDEKCISKLQKWVLEKRKLS